jgi:hypothetical protein
MTATPDVDMPWMAAVPPSCHSSRQRGTPLGWVSGTAARAGDAGPILEPKVLAGQDSLCTVVNNSSAALDPIRRWLESGAHND